MQKPIDMTPLHRLRRRRAEEDIETPVAVVMAQRIEAGLVFRGGVETDGFADVWFEFEEGAERSPEDVVDQFIAGHGGESAEAAVDGDVVAGRHGAGEVCAVDGAEGGVFDWRGEERSGCFAVGRLTQMRKADAGVHDGGEFRHLLVLHAHRAQAIGVGEDAVEVHHRRASRLLGGHGLQEGGVEEAEGHAGDVGWGGAAVAHLAEGLVGGVVASGVEGLRVGGVGEGAAGEEEMHGEIFLAHADALADEVVLVAAQFSLESRELALVGFLLPRDPFAVCLFQPLRSESAGDVVEAGVELDVSPFLCGRDGETEALAGEGRTVGGDVGEAEREEAA